VELNGSERRNEADGARTRDLRRDWKKAIPHVIVQRFRFKPVTRSVRSPFGAATVGDTVC
jgi:hypothetical protein